MCSQFMYKMFYNILKGISIFRSAMHLFGKEIILNGQTFIRLIIFFAAKDGEALYSQALGILDAHNIIWK